MRQGFIARTIKCVASGSSVPDHMEELAEYFGEVLADCRDYPQDTGYEDRIKIEAMRRAGYKAARDAVGTAT